MAEKYGGLWKVLKAVKLPVAVLLVAGVLTLLESAAALWMPLVTGDLVDSLKTGEDAGSILRLLAVILLLQAAFGSVGIYCLGFAGQKMTAVLRKKLFSHVLRLPVSFYDQNQSGELVSRVISDVTVVKSLIADHLVHFLAGLATVAGSVVILWFLDWKMTLVLFSSVILALVVILPIAARLHGISKELQDETAGLTAQMSQVLSEVRLVKAATAEVGETQKAGGTIQRLFGLGLREVRIQSVMAPFISVAMMGALVAILGYGGVRVNEGSLPAGHLVAFVIYLFNVVVPMVQFSYFFGALQKATGAAARLQDLLGQSLEPETGDTQPGSQADIRFEHLSFGYGEGEEMVLKEVSFDIPAGQTTAIVGPSGSGKSTLFALLERFYQPDEGRITAHGIPIETFSLAAWRRHLGLVAQESPLLAGTIRENLCYGLENEPSAAQLETAARAALAHEFISGMPNGYDTGVGERGVKLSGGQRQRIAIARALLKNPKLLLLDEATSSLDSQSEHQVQKALDRLMAGRTAVVIAHRLATVMGADQIMVLENGRITGQGTHETLLETHPLYQKLVAQQFKTSGFKAEQQASDTAAVLQDDGVLPAPA